MYELCVQLVERCCVLCLLSPINSRSRPCAAYVLQYNFPGSADRSTKHLIAATVHYGRPSVLLTPARGIGCSGSSRGLGVMLSLQPHPAAVRCVYIMTTKTCAFPCKTSQTQGGTASTMSPHAHLAQEAAVSWTPLVHCSPFDASSSSAMPF